MAVPFTAVTGDLSCIWIWTSW